MNEAERDLPTRDWRPARWPLVGLLLWAALGILGLLTGTIFRAHRRAVRAAEARPAAQG